MTTLVMVRYQLAADQAETNEELVRGVFAELADTAPAGLGYATFVLEDGLSFVHLASVDDGAQLGDVTAFARFKHGLGDRVVAPPVRSELRLLGSYRMLGG
jgi:hypothetical protein